MKAAVIDRYGAPEVVRVVDVPTPSPRPDEVLVRVVATAVTTGDARIRGARFPPGFAPFARLAFGVRRPRKRVLGSAFSGIVEAVGANTTGLAVGDEVCGMTGARGGAHAEYVAVWADRLARKPSAVTHEDAAGLLFGGTTALVFLRDKGRVGRGASVLVNGASGAVGTNAVQLARHLGATVTAVTSAANAELVAGLGADRVIDYTRHRVSEENERFDVVMDVVGTLPLAVGRGLLTDDGVFLVVVSSLGTQLRARGRVKAGGAPERAEDFAHLLQLVERGDLTVVVEAVHDLDDIADAYRRVDSGRKVGNVVVRPRSERG